MADTFSAHDPRFDEYIGATVIDYSGGNQTLSGKQYRGVYVSTTGHLKVDTAAGDTVTFSNLPVGFHKIAVVAIYQTGSTAAGLVLY